MPKGVPNKKYTGEFKQKAIETMYKEKLSATLTKEQKILFDKYKECCMDMYGMAELEAFVPGVKLGVKIIVETYTDTSQNFKEI